VAGLRAFELDLAFAVGPPDADLAAVVVAREPLVMCGPPGAAGAAPADSADRGAAAPPADADWALYPAGSRTRALIDAALARAGVRPRVVVESPNPEVLRQLVALGLGWSVLPAAVAAASGEALAVSAAVAERTVFGLQRRTAPVDARAAAFLEAALAAGRTGEQGGRG
jgi:DNA-binding transcriptional LysR family regulator